MIIRKPLLCLVLSFLFVGATLTLQQINPAHAEQSLSTEPVQVAQSGEEKPKPPKDKKEADLGDDDC